MTHCLLFMAWQNPAWLTVLRNHSTEKSKGSEKRSQPDVSVGREMPRQRHVRRHSVLKYGFAGYPPKPRASGYCLLYSLELRSRLLLSPKRTEPTATRLFLVEDRHCWSDIIRKLSYCAMPLFYLRKMAWSIKILFRNGMIQLLSQFPIKMLTRFTVSLMNTTNYGISRCATGTI